MSDSVTALAVTSNFAVESVVGVCAQTIYYIELCLNIYCNMTNFYV